MRANYDDYVVILKKFVAYIDSCEVIYDYISDCGAATFDVEAKTKEISKSYGALIYYLGDTEQEENANIYSILNFIIKNNIAIQSGVAMGYSNSNKYQDKVNGFNERVVLVFIRSIEGYLTKIGIDMDLNESIKYSITVNKGQVNLATDKAIINASQNNGLAESEVKDLLLALRGAMPVDMSAEDAEAVKDSIEVIESELTSSNPKKSLVKTALLTIQAIKSTTEFGAAVLALVQAVQAVL